MTKRKQDNSLIKHLLSVINQALPLEYAIRASIQVNQPELNRLRQMDSQIRSKWLTFGVSENLIHTESLMDFAWDVIQVGFPLSRRHGRTFFDKELVSQIQCGLASMREEFCFSLAQIDIPAAKYFRICDLLNGNDIIGMLNAVAKCLQDSRQYDLGSEIELERFIRGIREPVHLHPGIRYVTSERLEGDRTVESFGIVLDTEMLFSMSDLKHHLYEFIYQYAIRRETLHFPDKTSRALISEFLESELLGHIDNHKVCRIDGFVSPLAGLYCWDLVHYYRQNGRKRAVEDAVNDTLKIYPKNVREVSYEAIRKNYNTARSAINRVEFG